MSRTLRVLNIEDSKRDEALLRRHLERAGLEVFMERVETRESMKAALENGIWDVIVADYALPQFGALPALAVLKEAALDLPFIVVSGTIGEELAVEAMRAGAHDYVMKDKLARLVPVIERELVEAGNRRARRQAEQALRASESELRAIFSAMTDIIFIVDSEGRCLSVSRNDSIYRERASQLVGKLLHEVYSHDQAEFFLAHIRQALAERKAHRLEYVVEVDGKSTWLEGSVSPMSETTVVWIARDVTERITTDARMRLLARAIESTNEMVSVTDIDNRFTFVNGAFLRTYGYAIEEVLGRTPELVQPRNGTSGPLDEILERTRNGGWQGERRNRKKDGTHFLISLNTSPILDNQGKIIGLLGVARDISEQRLAERALNDAEDRMRFALEASGAGVWESDLRTGATYWSETCEKMHGLAPGTFGRTFQASVECILPADRQQVLQRIEKATRERTVAEIEYRTALADGTVRRIATTCHFFYDEFGLPVRGAGISFDVTERRSLEEQLRQSQKMEAIGHLAGGIAHDFNNMLTVINGYSELGLFDLPDTSPLRRNFKGIAEAGLRAAALTRQLLAFSRKQVLQPKVHQLNLVVTELEKMLRRLIGEDIDLRTRLSRDLGRIKADPGQVEQIILNLSVNARDAMPKGGKLTIETANIELGEAFTRQHLGVPAGSYVMLAVSDNGTGMDAETQARMFEPFYTTKQAGHGTGLGLSTVYGIVKQSGGSIWVYSELGRGTTFKVYFPRVIDESLGVTQTVKDRQNLMGTETILLTEDEAMVRALTCMVLERYGYRVLQAGDGATAIAICEQEKEPIHLLITDIIMPEMSGPDLVDQISRLRPELKVLFMSGYSDNTLAQHGLDETTPFIQKPFTPETVALKVRQVLDAKRSSTAP